MDNFAIAGMAWWNGLSELARIVALAAAGPNASVADAYRHYLGMAWPKKFAGAKCRGDVHNGWW